MINYYLGIPGSGKSYSGVNTIYDNFSDNKDAKKDLKKSYENCYTNINEFKFDLVNNVYKFDFDVFFEQISTLHGMYKAKKSDAELIEKAKEFKIYKTLFVLDECHQYFDVDKKELVWWLTYHRHLYHDIILITQNLSLVNSKYKPLAEAFYKAKSNSLTLSNKYFNYMYYTESRMSKASYVNNKKVLKRDAVFNLYHSGDSVSSKNVIKHFLMIALFFGIVLSLLMYLFYYSKQEQINDNNSVTTFETQTNENETRNISNENSIDDISNIILMEFYCNNNMCNDEIKYFDISVLNFAKENFNLHIINSRRVFSTVYITVYVDSEFKKFLHNGDSKHENTITDQDSLIPDFNK